MSYPSALESLLEDGRFVVRGLARFDFGTGTYGVWNGTGELVYEDFAGSGVTYKPNALIRVEDIPLGLGTAAVPLTIEMPESANYGVTPDVLATIEDEDYKGRPVTIYDAYFDPDSRELIHVEPLYRGYVDTIDHVVEDGVMKLVGHIETTALDNHRDGYRAANHEDQQLVSPGDMFFEHAARTGIETFEITLD